MARSIPMMISVRPADSTHRPGFSQSTYSGHKLCVSFPSCGMQNLGTQSNLSSMGIHHYLGCRSLWPSPLQSAWGLGHYLLESPPPTPCVHPDSRTWEHKLNMGSITTFSSKTVLKRRSTYTIYRYMM